LPISAPPGLDFLPEPVVKKANKISLSLDLLCAPSTPKVELPPGLSGGSVDKPLKSKKKQQVSLMTGPPGLSLPSPRENGIESDDTSAGQRSSSPDQSNSSDGESPPERVLPSICLVLAERNRLKANAPMFTPVLAPSTAAMLMPEPVQRTPLRTALRAKADMFMPTSSNWYDAGNYAEQEGYYAEQEDITSSSFSQSYGMSYDAEKPWKNVEQEWSYEEQEWSYEEEETPYET